MVRYILYYTDNKQVVKEFNSDAEAAWYCYNEGNSLLNWEKIV